MADDVRNKGLQQLLFVICLLLVVVGVVTIITSGLSKLFEFKDTFTQPLTTKQQPFIIIFLFAVAGLYYSIQNLRRIRDEEKGSS
jgi:uncharacterized membrane protein